MKKILVIGASIAGPAVCYWLKKCGYEPTLIEKNNQTRKGGYAIDIRGIAIGIAKQMGIYEKVCAQRTQLKFGRFVDAQGHLLHEEQGERVGFRQGEEVEIVRGDLVEILMQTIPDVPCYFSQSVDRIDQHDSHVTVNFKDGHAENFDLVLGADGLHSSIRRKVFSADEYHLLNLGCYICVFDIPNFLNLQHTEMLFEANEKMVSITSYADSNRAQAGFMFRSKYVFNDIRDEREQKQFMRDTFRQHGWESDKLLQLMDECEGFYFDSITQVKMTSWAKGRVALVGDAGYCASPLSGQGTSLALVGAYILAGELKASGGDFTQAFARYNQILHPYVEANQSFGQWVSETFLVTGHSSKEQTEDRGDKVMEKMKLASHAITLPDYF